MPFMTAFKHASVLAAITFDADTRITSFSLGAEDIAGHSKDEVVGEPVTQLLADETVFELPLILKTAKERGKWEGEITCADCNNTPFPAEGVVLSLVENGNRGAEYLLLIRSLETYNDGDDSNSVYWDIGCRVREHIHSLNNSLAVIMGSTQLLSLNSGCTEKVQSDIKKLYMELERVALVVGTLHEYAFSLCEKATTRTLQDNAFLP